MFSWGALFSWKQYLPVGQYSSRGNAQMEINVSLGRQCSAGEGSMFSWGAILVGGGSVNLGEAVFSWGAILVGGGSVNLGEAVFSWGAILVGGGSVNLGDAVFSWGAMLAGGRSV